MPVELVAPALLAKGVAMKGATSFLGNPGALMGGGGGGAINGLIAMTPAGSESSRVTAFSSCVLPFIVPVYTAVRAMSSESSFHWLQ